MRTRMFVLATLLLFAWSCKEKQTIKTDAQNLNLKGNVKSVSTISYYAIDVDGNISTGERGRKNSWEKDKLTLFNVNGNVTEIQFFDSYDKPTGKREVNYDEVGRAVVEISYDASGEIDFRRTFTLDVKGNRIEERNYDSLGNLQFRSTSTFDSKGNEVESIWYNPDGTTDCLWVSEFDKNGNRVKMTRYDQDGGVEVIFAFTYGERGRIVEESELKPDGALLRKKTFDCDENCHVIEEVIVEKDGTVAKWKYDYELDDNNNWVKRIEYHNGIPKFVVVRTIEYY